MNNIFLLLASTMVLASCSKKDDTNTVATEIKTPTYQYTITNWNDGWTSTLKDDWVEVTKGDVKVYLHYAQASTNIAADPEPLVNNAWNILVAPRYSNLEGYKVVSPSLDYERSYLGYATVTENSSGKRVFVALFKKGNSGWIEVVTPDKNTFIARYGFDPATIIWSTTTAWWGPVRAMANYNRFAVAATDVESTGKWTNNFGSNTFYYSMYTGLGVGMSSYSSTEEFTFTGGKGYSWVLYVANSGGGSTGFAKASSKGSYTLTDNWHMHYTDIEGKAVDYQVWFGAVKGGRVLFIDGNPFSWVGK